MGMNFTAYLSHNLNEKDITTLCNELNSSGQERFPRTKMFIKDLQSNNTRDIRKEWLVSHDELGGTIELDGPCGLHLHFQRECVL
ncbi:hypothetical protein [Paenibacillus sp. PL2-23]|uniref:hypothetical protein n=1 Tax=Paenibacillus sp. PL2-23 TaxID=2100729 RepID=UPI0030FB0974